MFLTASPVLAGRDSEDRPGMVAGIELLPGSGVWSRLLSVRRHGERAAVIVITGRCAAAANDRIAVGRRSAGLVGLHDGAPFVAARPHAGAWIDAHELET